VRTQRPRTHSPAGGGLTFLPRLKSWACGPCSVIDRDLNAAANLASLDPSNIRRGGSRSDEEGFGLFDTLVGMLIGAVALIIAILLLTVILSSSNLSAAELVSHAAAVDAFAQIDQEVGNASPLEHCDTDQAGAYNTKSSDCPDRSPVGSAFVAAGADGMCFYAEPSDTPGTATSAPDFVCVVTGGDSLYLLRYSPNPQATRTTCPPSGCWGSGVASLQTSCAENPSESTCWEPGADPNGQSERLLGTVTAGGTPFSYQSPSGATIAVPAADPNVAIVDVDLTFSGSGPKEPDYTLQVQIGTPGSQFAATQNWDGV